MPDPNLITLNPLYSVFFDALRENPSLYQDFLQVRALRNKTHAIIAKWEGVVAPGFFTDEHNLFTDEHNLFTEKVMGLLAKGSESSLLEDYKQFQADGETVRSIWDKHRNIVDMRFWTVEAVPVVYSIGAFLGLDDHSDIPA